MKNHICCIVIAIAAAIGGYYIGTRYNPGMDPEMTELAKTFIKDNFNQMNRMRGPNN
jgi:hypothetical protein